MMGKDGLEPSAGSCRQRSVSLTLQTHSQAFAFASRTLLYPTELLPRKDRIIYDELRLHTVQTQQ